jgi:hypothetical protein
MSMPYTQEEEKWLEHQFDLIDTAYQSVSLGEELLQELMEYFQGTPLSIHFCSSAAAIGRERVWRIARTQEDLPLSRYSDDGFQMAFALFACKFEACRTSLEQVQCASGYRDEELWKSKYGSLVFKRPLKKLTLFDPLLQYKTYFSDAEKSEMNETFAALAAIIQDPILYGLMVLLAVTLSDQVPVLPKVPPNQANY